MMKHYTATFEDGTVMTRSSEREYSHAWRITRDGEEHAKGFSRTEKLARDQITSFLNRARKFGAEHRYAGAIAPATFTSK